MIFPPSNVPLSLRLISLLVPNNLDSFSCSDIASPLVLTPLVRLGRRLRKYDRQGSTEIVLWRLQQDAYSIYNEPSSLSPLEATPLPDKGCSQFPSKLYLERVGSPNVRAALFAPLRTKSQARDPSRAHSTILCSFLKRTLRAEYVQIGGWCLLPLGHCPPGQRMSSCLIFRTAQLGPTG